MDEDELRAAMRTTTTLTTPPPMASATALAAGRRAVRRRTAWAGAGLTAFLVAGSMVVVGVGLRPHSAPWSTAAGTPERTPAPSAKPTWPLDGNGQPQQDATARSGLHYDQGVKVLSLVSQSVPAGWTQPTGVTDSGLPLREHQGAIDGHSWSYQGSAAVSKNNQTGRILAEVHTPGNGLTGAPCALAQKFWGMGGTCQVVTVGKAKVGVVVSGNDDRIDQWAAYRYPDGTVVFVAQSRWATNGPSSLKPLTNLPLSVHALATLAVDPKFHLS